MPLYSKIAKYCLALVSIYYILMGVDAVAGEGFGRFSFVFSILGSLVGMTPDRFIRGIFNW